MMKFIKKKKKKLSLSDISLQNLDESHDRTVDVLKG